MTKCAYCGVKITAHSAEQARWCLTNLSKIPGVREAHDRFSVWVIEQIVERKEHAE